VVDNTNPTVEQRAKYIALAKAANFRLVGYYFQSELRECLRRNESRPAAEQVPVKGVVGTYKQLKLPALSEGFDALLYVRITEDGQFVVEEWNEGNVGDGARH
jgi:predicted kinase